MGIIVGIGGGDYANGEIFNIAEHIVMLSGKKNPKLVFFPTAGHDNVDGDEPIQNTFEKLGCSFETLFLTDEKLTEKEIADTICNADIVYVGGGNVKFLMDTLNSTNASKYLRIAYENGTILSGFSAGSLCWFKRGYDDCGENGEFIFNECLGFLPFCNCPHYESDSWQSFKEAVKNQDLSAIACENGAALVYNNGKYYTLCGNEGGNTYYFDAKDGYNETLLDKDAKMINAL